MIISCIAFIKKAVTSVMAFLLVSCVSMASLAQSSTDQAPTPKAKVYFALGDRHHFPLREPKKNFDCSDKIFIVVELTQFEKKKYSFSVAWVDPSDKERERTEYPFHVNKDETRLWSWLSLSRAKGAGMLQWINPAAGLEEFIGEWTVEVKIDNKKIAQKSFEVIC